MEEKGTTDMKKILGTTVALAVLAILFISSAQAVIKIETATVQGGVAFIKGNGAVKGAAITWEGFSVTTANKTNGGFSFFSILPDDCTGELKDTAETKQVAVLLCTPAPTGGVLKTGQTNDFGVTGSDGDLEKGTARSYASNADGTITDNSTGLVWEKLTNPGDGSIHDFNNFYNWADAFVKIVALNTVPCFAGHCDWRLPNVNELQTLTDWGRVNPAIDPVFNNSVDSFTQSSNYWSSTTYRNDSFSAWLVDFLDGQVFPGNPGINGFYVRAVRGGS